MEHALDGGGDQPARVGPSEVVAHLQIVCISDDVALAALDLVERWCVGTGMALNHLKTEGSPSAAEPTIQHRTLPSTPTRPTQLAEPWHDLCGNEIHIHYCGTHSASKFRGPTRKYPQMFVKITFVLKGF